MIQTEEGCLKKQCTYLRGMWEWFHTAISGTNV